MYKLIFIQWFRYKSPNKQSYYYIKHKKSSVYHFHFSRMFDVYNTAMRSFMWETVLFRVTEVADVDCSEEKVSKSKSWVSFKTKYFLHCTVSNFEKTISLVFTSVLGLTTTSKEMFPDLRVITYSLLVDFILKKYLFC